MHFIRKYSIIRVVLLSLPQYGLRERVIVLKENTSHDEFTQQKIKENSFHRHHLDSCACHGNSHFDLRIQLI